jgi:predicted AlkP superfamily pyrophosphatase or phosphodiesterase
MIAAGSLTAEQCAWMNPGPQRKNMTWHDSTWTAAAKHIIERHRPNLLLYHLLNTDAVHHQYGPGSMASYTALSYADRLVGDLVDSIGAAGLGDSTTFVITTDHGFKKVSKYAYPNIVLRKAGYLEAFGPTITKCDAAAMAQGGMAFIYVTNSTRKSEILPKLKEMFATAEGVAQVVDGNDAPALGMPKPNENQGMGDLVLFAKEGYAFNAAATGDAAVGPTTNYAGTHGYPNSDPELDGIFIISGRGIKKGVTLERMTNLDVAPTVARLMGLKLPDMDGRVLEQVLDAP